MSSPDDLAGLGAHRPSILAMTGRAEHAVLAPRDPGGVPHELRAALAARIAALNARNADADVPETAPDGVADPSRTPDDPRLAAIVRFVDVVSAAPGGAEGTEIEALRAAGVPDADIVRLAEVCAFLAYRHRVAAGLALLEEEGEGAGGGS